MSYKRLTPCIFIAGGKAVRWFDDRTVLTEDVIALAKQYNANGADELLVFDLSDSDEDHEESIDLIKKITGSSVFRWLREEIYEEQRMLKNFFMRV